jgi:hypothetical protein
VATDLETRLRSLADRLPLPEPSVTDRVVAGVTENVQAARPAAAPSRRRSAGRSWRGRVAVVAVGGAAVVGAMLVGSTGDGARLDPAAAAVLRQAAITAAHQPALPPLKAGQYYHFRDTEIGWVEKAAAPNSFSACGSSCPPPPADWVVKLPIVNDYWIAADGSGLRVPTSGRPTFRSGAVRRDYRRIYGFPVSHPMGILTRDRFPKGQGTFGWNMTYRQLQHLPSNPAKLLELVRRQAAPSSQATDPTSANPLSYEEFTVIGDVMRDSPLKPRVRAALYTILSQLPNVQLVGHVTDPLGRPGIEVAMQRSSGEPRDILIFDPHTAQLLSEGDGGYSEWSIVGSIGR